MPLIVLASGSGRCEINNGGCWKDSRHGRTYSACTVSHQLGYLLSACVVAIQKHIYAVFNVQNDGCKCPDGFKGDGVHKCEGKNRFVNPVQLLDVLAILQSL